MLTNAEICKRFWKIHLHFTPLQLGSYLVFQLVINKTLSNAAFLGTLTIPLAGTANTSIYIVKKFLEVKLHLIIAWRKYCVCESWFMRIHFFYLRCLSSIHENANCIAMFWTVCRHSLGSCYFPGVRATHLPHKGGSVLWSALPNNTTSELAGLFSTTSHKCQAPSRVAIGTIFWSLLAWLDKGNEALVYRLRIGSSNHYAITSVFNFSNNYWKMHSRDSSIRLLVIICCWQYAGKLQGKHLVFKIQNVTFNVSLKMASGLNKNTIGAYVLVFF